MDAPKFKDYILPVVFPKGLSDVFEDELARLAEEYGSPDVAARIVEQERQRGTIAGSRGSVSFYIPENARRPNIRRQATGLGQYLTDAVRAVARENLRLRGVIDLVDFNTTAAGPRIVSDEYLARLVDVLSPHRLGFRDVEPDILGRAYEYLLRKFAEGQGEIAGEFYTPREVAVLMAHILEPQPAMIVYDPPAVLAACSSKATCARWRPTACRKTATDACRQNTHPCASLVKKSIQRPLPWRA